MKKQVVHVMLFVLLLCAPVLSRKEWRSTAEPSSSISRAAITRLVGMLP